MKRPLGIVAAALTLAATTLLPAALAQDRGTTATPRTFGHRFIILKVYFGEPNPNGPRHDRDAPQSVRCSCPPGAGICCVLYLEFEDEPPLEPPPPERDPLTPSPGPAPIRAEADDDGVRTRLTLNEKDSTVTLTFLDPVPNLQEELHIDFADLLDIKEVREALGYDRVQLRTGTFKTHRTRDGHGDLTVPVVLGRKRSASD